jgi:hypothetical protein
MGWKTIRVIVNIPNRLAGPLIWLLLLYRRLRYGYTFRKIPLTQGEFAIVDPEDYERLAKYKWHLSKSPTGSYAARWQRTRPGGYRKKIWMHRQVIDVPDHLLCDHVNGHGLDNRRVNLRPATVSQNLCNRPKTKTKTLLKYKGLEWDKIQRKWKVRIQCNGRKIYLGSFSNEIDAAKAYDEKAKILFGKYARFNLARPKSSIWSRCTYILMCLFRKRKQKSKL